MASTAKQMATEMSVERQPKLTTVTARTVLSVYVQMSVTEIGTLIESFGKAEYELSEVQRTIQREFCDAVSRLR